MEREKMIDIKPLYTMYGLITMPEYQAGELLLEEIKKSLPDIQFIKNLLEYSKIYVNWQDEGGLLRLLWLRIKVVQKSLKGFWRDLRSL